MKRKEASFPFGLFTLDQDAPDAMFRQLYAELRDAILTGRLTPGMRLPATRELAAELRVSRNTILGAYQELYAEGYVEGVGGSGTFVTRTLPEELLNSEHRQTPTETSKSGQSRLSKRGRALAEILPYFDERVFGRPIAFRNSIPDPRNFPFNIWSKLLARHSRNPSPELSGYSHPAGLPRLRESIAKYLRSARSVNCDPEQVIIVSGGQMSLDIVAQLLLDSGDAVAVEDPGYFGIRGTAAKAGLRVVDIPVDEEGISVEALKKRGKLPRLVYITPSCQYPLGVTMSLQRRLNLLEWSRERYTWIIEDDYDGELRYSGRPIPSLQGLDTDGRVIYMGTFSKVTFPGLRLGYMIAPRGLEDAFVKARVLSDLQMPNIVQAALADFIDEGHFERHLRRMRKLYATRQACLVEEAAKHLNGLVELDPAEAGMHLIGWLPEGVDDTAVAYAGWELGVLARPLSASSAAPIKRGGLVLGYTAFDERQIREGVKVLRAALLKTIN